MDNLDAAELDELEALYDLVPAGHWMGDSKFEADIWCDPPEGDEDLWIGEMTDNATADCVIAMFNAMPALLAMARRVAALEAENARLQRIVELDEQIERMWSAGDYEAELRKLSPDEFRRLHENQWIPPEGSE